MSLIRSFIWYNSSEENGERFTEHNAIKASKYTDYALLTAEWHELGAGPLWPDSLSDYGYDTDVLIHLRRLQVSTNRPPHPHSFLHGPIRPRWSDQLRLVLRRSQTLTTESLAIDPMSNKL